MDSRLTEPGDAVRRRRECAGCGDRFTTYERAEAPTVIGASSATAAASGSTARSSCAGSSGPPASGRSASEQLEALVGLDRRGRAARAVRRSRADQIGDLAERGLARLDPVAAIQFASVYRNLADLDELEAVVRRFKEEPLPGADQLALEASSGPSVPSDPESSIGRSP